MVTNASACSFLRGAAIAGLAVGILGTVQSSPAATLEQVKYNMSWLPQGSQVGVIVAQEKGFYEEAGLSVEPVRGYGGIRTTNEIDQGLFEFGYGNPLGVILNRTKGGATVMIGSVNDRWPGGLCFVKERHDLSGPADLKGLTAGGGQNSPVQVMLPVWLERRGVSPDSVTLLQMDPAVVDASLIEGQIDLAECWLGSNKALLEQRAEQAGVTIGWVPYDLDIYGSGIVTTEKIVNERPEVVRNFLQATYEGYRYAFEHPDEAVDIMVKQFPVLDREATLQQIEETEDLMKGAETTAHGLGWMTEEKMKNTLEFLATAYEVKEKIEASEIYTNKFLKTQ